MALAGPAQAARGGTITLFTHNLAVSGGGLPNRDNSQASLADSVLSTNGLNDPLAVGLDEQGNLYVADTFNSRVLEYGLAPIKLYLPLMLR